MGEWRKWCEWLLMGWLLEVASSGLNGEKVEVVEKVVTARLGHQIGFSF